MPVPEAAVYEYRRLIPRKDYVGPAGKARAAQPVSEPHSVESVPDLEFDLRILAANARHLRGSLLRSKAVHQGQRFAFFLAGLADEEAGAWIRWGTMMRATSPITGTTTELPNCL